MSLNRPDISTETKEVMGLLGIKIITERDNEDAEFCLNCDGVIDPEETSIRSSTNFRKIWHADCYKKDGEVDRDDPVIIDL